PSARAPAGEPASPPPWSGSASRRISRYEASTRSRRSWAKRSAPPAFRGGAPALRGGELGERPLVQLVPVAAHEHVPPDQHRHAGPPLPVAKANQGLGFPHRLTGGVVLDEAVAVLDEEPAGLAGKLERAIAVDGMGVERPALVRHAGLSQSAASQLRGRAVARAIIEDDAHVGSVVGPTRSVKRTGASWRRRAGSGRSGRAWRAYFLPASFFLLTEPQIFFGISEGPVGPDPNTDSLGSLHPFKLSE